MYFTVTKAEYVGDYKIRIQFEDESEGITDLSSYPNPSNVFKIFLEKGYFRSFAIENGSLTWDQGEVDIAPERLCSLATGKPIIYQALHSKV